MQYQLSLSNTRLTTDHLLSGTLASAIGAGALSYNNYKKQKISKNEAVKNTIKLALEGGVASGSAIACSNSIVDKNYANALLSAVLGFGAIVAIEKIANQYSK